MSDIEWTEEAKESMRDLCGRPIGPGSYRIINSSQAGFIAENILAEITSPDHPVYKIIAAHALREAKQAFQHEGLALKPGGWGSNPADMQTVQFAILVSGWLGGRADLLDPPKPQVHTKEDQR